MAFVPEGFSQSDDVDFEPLWFDHRSFELALLDCLPDPGIGFSQVHDQEVIEPLGNIPLLQDDGGRPKTFLIHFGGRNTAAISISGDSLMRAHIKEHLLDHAVHVTTFHVKKFGVFGAALIDAVCVCQDRCREMADAEELQWPFEPDKTRWWEQDIISETLANPSSPFFQQIDSISFFREFSCKAEAEKSVRKNRYTAEWERMKENYATQYKLGQIPAGISVASLNDRSASTYGLNLVPLQACEKAFAEDHVLSLVSRDGIACLILLENSRLFEGGSSLTAEAHHLIKWARERLQLRGKQSSRENIKAVYATIAKALVDEHRQLGHYSVWPGRRVPALGPDFNQSPVVDFIVIEPDFDAGEFMD